MYEEEESLLLYNNTLECSTELDRRKNCSYIFSFSCGDVHARCERFKGGFMTSELQVSVLIFRTFSSRRYNPRACMIGIHYATSNPMNRQPLRAQSLDKCEFGHFCSSSPPRLTLVSASDGRPKPGGFALDAGAVPERASVGSRPLAARHLGVRPGEGTMARGEERVRASRVLADVEAA